ncbi:MAG: GAF domain-containing protein [Acidimicrobiaceae bacterium]|nr:GAF domain-containing protein [Acidimicrobiaceae bacterium]
MGLVPYHAIKDPERLRALLDAAMVIGADLDLHRVLERVTETACSLTGARYGAVGVLDHERQGLAQFVTVGIDEATFKRIGYLPEGAGILGLLIVDQRPLRLANLSTHPDSVGFPPGHPPMHTFLGVPLRVADTVFGNLYLTEKHGGEEFTEEDEALMVALASLAGVVVDHARLLDRVGDLTLAADRERIARDLHDRVIQRLFATGLALQASLPLADNEALHGRIDGAIAQLDETIRQVRTAIFALEPPPSAGRGVRVRVLEVCAEVTRSLGFEPEVRFNGAVDSRIGADIAGEMLTTLREALSNVARHARAGAVEVDLSVNGSARLRVADNGVGTVKRRYEPGRGLANMAERAASLGGSFSLGIRPGGGTEVSWSVPLGH